MNKYIINPDSYKILQRWTEKYKQYVIPSLQTPFWNRSELHFQDTDVIAYVIHRENKDRIVSNKAKINCKVDGKIAFRVQVEIDETKESDFNLKFDLTDEFKNKYGIDKCCEIVQCVSNAYIMVNAFMFYGNLAENRNVKALGKNIDEDKVIIFRVTKDNKVVGVPMGSHKSPEGVFSVRGHLRSYKNGHTVWIDEYFKGKEKE